MKPNSDKVKSVSDPVNLEPLAQINPVSRPRIGWLNKIAMSMVFCALSLPIALSVFEPDCLTIGETKKVNWSSSKHEIQKAIEDLTDSADLEQAVIFAQFEKDLKVVQDKNRRGALHGMNQTSSELLEVSSIALLLSDMVKDQTDDGHRAEGHMRVYMKPFATTLQHTTIRIDDLINKLNQDLAALNNRFAQQAGEIIEEKEADLPKANFDQLMQTQNEIRKNYAMSGGLSFVAVVGEAICVKVTTSASKKLIIYFARVLAPMVGKVVAGGGAVVADGPLPFGDIVAVGLAAWTVYDLATLPGEIREDLRDELHDARRSYLDELDAETIVTLKNLRKTSSESREKVEQVLVGQLNN